MFSEIYKITGLTPQNTISSLQSLNKLFNLEHAHLEQFYLQHEFRNEKIKLGDNFVVSLTEIFLASKHIQKIINHVDKFESYYVMKYYSDNILELDIEKFKKSHFYKMILINAEEKLKNFFCMNNSIESENINLLVESKFDEQENYNYNNVNEKNTEAYVCKKIKTNNKSISNTNFNDAITYLFKNKDEKSEDHKIFIKFIKIIIEKFKKEIDVFALLIFLSEKDCTDINCDFYSFRGLLINAQNEISKFMIFEINNYEEIDLIKIKLTDFEFRNSVVKYIKTQGIINTTILIFAIFINSRSFYDLNLKNIDYDKILRFVEKEEIYLFKNIYFKKQLLHYILKCNFDSDMFLICIEIDTLIKYKELQSIETENYTQNEIFLIYFLRKIKIVKEKNDLINDVKIIIANKIYDIDLCKFLIVNDLDFGLIDDFFEELITDENCKKVCLKNYIKKLIENEIVIDDIFYYNVKKNIDWIKSNDQNLKLPLLDSYDIFEDIEKNKILVHNFQFYDINQLLKLIYSITNLTSTNLITNNFDKIFKAIDKLLIIDKLNINHNLILSLVEKLSQKELQMFILKIKNVNIFEDFYLRDDTLSFSINQKAVQSFYYAINDHLLFLKNLKRENISRLFLKTFLNLLFQSSYDYAAISETILIFLNSNEITNDVLIIICNFVVNKVLENDFFQEKELFLVKDFLNYLYCFIKKNGKDLQILQRCEDIISRLKIYADLYKIDLQLKVIKNIY
ncbi:hypothetical protein GVAV_001885 [Gurleya vavrai]